MHGRDKKRHKSGEPRETTITGCWLCSNNDEVATLNNNYRTGPTYSTLNLDPDEGFINARKHIDRQIH